MEGKLPPQIEQQIRQLQQFEVQLQNILTQKQQLQLELGDIETALKYLQEAKDDVKLFKSVGSLLIEGTKEKVMNELKEKRDLIDLRLKTLQKQEEKIRSRIEELRSSIKGLLDARGIGG